MENRDILLFVHRGRDARDFIEFVTRTLMDNSCRTMLPFSAAKTSSDGIIVDEQQSLSEAVSMVLDTRDVVVLDDVIDNPMFGDVKMWDIRKCGATLVWVIRRRVSAETFSRITTTSSQVYVDGSFGKKSMMGLERWWSLSPRLEYDNVYEQDKPRSYRRLSVGENRSAKESTIQNILNRLAEFYLRESFYTQ
jgi:hypothetical protein